MLMKRDKIQREIYLSSLQLLLKKEREALIINLEKIEKKSKKYKRKWSKTKGTVRDKYLDMAFPLKEFKNKIYYQVFKETKSYQDLTNLVIAKAINRYIKREGFKQYKATILIDGLNKTQESRVSKALRDLGIKTRKVKGIRDEADAIIRLADSLAGMIREGSEGNKKFKKIIIQKKILNELV